MSWRSMVEINHDLIPAAYNEDELLAWSKTLARYVRGGQPEDLPRGVTFFHIRHHSADCPLGEPPCGWDNDK